MPIIHARRPAERAADLDIHRLPRRVWIQPRASGALAGPAWTTAETALTSPEELATVDELFQSSDYVGVLGYLQAHPYLVDSIIEARSILSQIYGIGASYRLELTDEYDDGVQPTLFLLVRTELSTDDARELLAKFDDLWWTDASERSHGRLNIDIEYR